MVPRFPGSAIPSNNSELPFGGRGVQAGTRSTASTPCGDASSLSFAKTASETRSCFSGGTGSGSPAYRSDRTTCSTGSPARKRLAHLFDTLDQIGALFAPPLFFFQGGDPLDAFVVFRRDHMISKKPSCKRRFFCRSFKRSPLSPFRQARQRQPRR